MKRLWLYLCALIWLALAGWVWIGIPRLHAVPVANAIAAAWFLAAALWPAGFYLSLVPALALFGNNPGGPHHLYMLDLAMMGLVVGHLARRASGRVAAGGSRLDPWVTAFVLWSWLSLVPQLRFLWVEFDFDPRGFMFNIFSHYANAPTYGLQCALKLTLAAGLFVQLRDQPWKSRRLERWLAWALWALAATAVLGLGNYFGFVPLAWWRGENIDIARFGYPRLQSLYWHSGWYAQYVEALAPAALAMAWHARGGRRAAAWAFVLLLALVTFLTMQRAGWLGLTAGCAAVVAAATWMRGGRSAAWLRIAVRMAGVVAVLIALALAMAALSHDFRHRAAELLAYRHRTLIWEGASWMIRAHPAAGIGIGNYHQTHLAWFKPGEAVFDLDENFKGTAHNLFLHVAAERGLVGLGLLLAILAVAARILKRRMESIRKLDEVNDSERIAVLAIAGGLTALAVDGLFQYTFYIRTIDILFWLLIGWTAGIKAKPLKPWPGWVWPALTLAMIGFSLWSQREHFKPRMYWVGDRDYILGGRTVGLELPAGADRVELRVASVDPDNQRDPVKFTIKAGDKVLREETFTTQTAHAVTLDVRGAGGRLTVEASRDWSPFAFGDRSIPARRIGVLYLPAEKK